MTADHEHYWVPDALCVPTQPARATVLFRCRVKGCALLGYGHAGVDEIQEPRLLSHTTDAMADRWQARQ